MNDSTSLLARTILDAHQSVPIDALPKEVWIADEADAYRVQDLINVELGGVGGWKVARAPDGIFRCSAIPLNRIFNEGKPSPYRVPSKAGIEFEIGVRFRKTIDLNSLPRKPSDLARLIDKVFPAIEIVNSRFSPELQGTQHLQLADHQNCLMIIADSAPCELNLFGAFHLTVQIGEERRIVVVEQNRLAEIRQSLIWLCEHALRRGRPILKADVVITGALLGAEPLRFDENYVVCLNDRHALTRRFAQY